MKCPNFDGYDVPLIAFDYINALEARVAELEQKLGNAYGVLASWERLADRADELLLQTEKLFDNRRTTFSDTSEKEG